MSSFKNLGGVGTLLVLAVAASEVLIMISPFAGFFLNHSVVTTSAFLEWQRVIGRMVFALGLWGFIISAFQVYGKKLIGGAWPRGCSTVPHAIRNISRWASPGWDCSPSGRVSCCWESG